MNWSTAFEPQIEGLFYQVARNHLPSKRAGHLEDKSQ